MFFPLYISINSFISLGLKALMEKYPKVLILTTEISDDVPTHFGEKYFGTEQAFINLIKNEKTRSFLMF